MITAALLAALIAVESSGQRHAIGDGGRAHGCLQIHGGVIADVNRVYGTHYRLHHAYSVSDAKEICRLYLQHYATAAQLGHEPTDQDAARIWNGGPDGWMKTATDGYWEQVKAILPEPIPETPPPPIAPVQFKLTYPFVYNSRG